MCPRRWTGSSRKLQIWRTCVSIILGGAVFGRLVLRDGMGCLVCVDGKDFASFTLKRHFMVFFIFVVRSNWIGFGLDWLITRCCAL